MTAAPSGLKPCFRALYTILSDRKRYEVRPVFEHYAKDERSLEKVNVCVRHDVDFALNLVLPLAEYEHALGIRATYYFLTDTAPYRVWESDVPRRVAALGHEVGIHSDHGYEQAALGRVGLERLREDVARMSAHCGIPVKGVAWHGGKHVKALGVHNFDLYEKEDPASLGLSYHDAVFYREGTRKWKTAALISDGENNLRFVPGKIKKILGESSPGGEVLVITHPFMMFPSSYCQPLEYPPYPHLSPPLERDLLMDLDALLRYNKTYLGPVRTRLLRGTAAVLKLFKRGKV